MLRTACLCLLLICKLHLYAQNDSIASNTSAIDTAAFFSKLKSHVLKSKKTKAEVALKKFLLNAKNNKFNSTQITQIEKTCTSMWQKKMVAFPYFTDYLQALNVYIETPLEDESPFDEWLVVSEQVAQNSGKLHQYFKDYMSFSAGFFANQHIHQSENKNWLHTAEKFNFSFEDSLAILIFEEGNLTGYTEVDSLIIKKTTGKYYPSIYRWKGKSGLVDWSQNGLATDTVFANFASYELNVKEGEYNIPNSTFTYLNFLNKPLKGDLKGKLSVSKSNSKAYPQFSAQQKIELNNLGDNVKYKGGFALQGKNIIGLGDSIQPAQLNFYAPQKAIHIKATADKFEINDFKDINTKAAELLIYFGTDSIYHPNLALQYNIQNRELKILRSNMKGINIPYNDSYHGLEFKVDGLYWQLDSTFFNLNMIASDGATDPAIFKSHNYFNKKDIQKYRSFTDINPIYELKAYSDNNKTRFMPAAEFADALGTKFTTKSIQKLVLSLVEDGFVYYNPASKIIQIKDKVILHGLANVNKSDYDVLKILSEAKNDNAVFDISNKMLTLEGVTNVRLSKAKDVVILPRNNTINIGKNRNLNFNGTVLGGRVDFVGNDFKMDYQNYTIKMPVMQEILINYPSFTMTASGQPELEPVSTKIEDVSGMLYIDMPENKSGLMGNRDFPKFKSDGTARTYYDEGPFKNLYRRDSFYFEIKPFQLDSLWILSPELVNLEGKLVSSEIFADLQQTLSIQLDRSLGFETQAPEAGYPMYNGAGTFKGKLKLNSKGLNGSGSFRALTAELNSNTISFFPDSILATCDTFFLEKRVANPHQPLTFSNGPVDVNWKAKKDTLLIRKKNNPFSLYNDQAAFNGDLLLSSKGLYGRGSLNWEGGALSSNFLKFESEVASSEISDLSIQALDTSSIAFSTKNVNARVDFENALGKFNTSGNLKIDLPFNQFETTMSAFDWDMKNGLIELYTPVNLDKAYYFSSTDKDKEGLRFKGKSAVYNLNNYLLQANGVPHIYIADSKIIPDSNLLTVNPGGVFDTLYNAIVWADTTDLKHKIYDATVFIESGNQLKGFGQYDFVSSKLGTQTIFFDSLAIASKSNKKQSEFALRTVGKGNIEESANFKLDQLFDYQGEVNLYSNEPFLEFDGYSKINLKNDSLATNWFQFKDFIDPENVQIEMGGDLMEVNKDTLAIGIHFNADANQLYTVFINKPISSKDHALVKANGFINYDRAKNIFSIGDKDKIKNGNYQGRLFSFNDNTGLISTEGKINMGANYPLMNIDVAGVAENDLLRKKFTFKDLVVGLDFLFDEDLMKILGNTFQDANEEADEIDYTAETFKKGIAELVKPKKVDETIEAIDRLGYYQKTKDLKYQLLLADLDMQFNEVSRTIISTQPFGLAYAGDKYINRMVMGYVEFGSRIMGDYFNIYLETQSSDLDDDNEDEEGKEAAAWFYFAYKNGQMDVLSSDGDFNSQLEELKLPKRELKEKKQFYRYQLGNFIKKDNFVARMKGQAGY